MNQTFTMQLLYVVLFCICFSDKQPIIQAPNLLLKGTRALRRFQQNGDANTMGLILQFSQEITISPATAASASPGDRATEPVLAPSHPTPRLLPP